MRTKAEPRIFTLTVTLPGREVAAVEILKHPGVLHYLEAGYELAAEGTRIVRRRATVPLIVPEDWA